VAPVLEDPDGNLYCPLLNEFEALMVGYGKSVAGIYEVFKRIEKSGPIGLGVKLFHSVDKKLKIYEFVKGDLRVFCFLAPHGPVCVCSTVRLKKGQSVDRSAVRVTAEFAKNYRVAYDNSLIQFYTTDKEGNLVRDIS
jgi:hypothetical protein